MSKLNYLKNNLYKLIISFLWYLFLYLNVLLSFKSLIVSSPKESGLKLKLQKHYKKANIAFKVELLP